uniref:General transcription factor IIH subunit 4 n=1 Tax=Panagrolaimus sp. ES5 TaxID=591445 RepID=A0AC34FQA5_9BILA
MATSGTFEYYPFLKMLSKMGPEGTSNVYKCVPSTLFTLNMLDQPHKDVINFLMTNSPINVEGLCAPEMKAKVRAIIEFLATLRIVYVQDGITNLCQDFRKAYIMSITLRQRNQTDFNRLKEGPSARFRKLAVTELFQKGNERWDSILKFLISPNSGDGNNISANTTTVFKELKYLRTSATGSNDITSKGFQFLLQGRHAQIWLYLSAYLKHLTKEHPDHAPAIIDIFCSLVMLAPSIPTNISKASYFAKAVDDTRMEIPYGIPNYPHKIVNEFFMHMRELGFIYIRKRKDGYFYLTPILSMLRNTGSIAVHQSLPSSKQDGYLVAESNYRIYAYTNDHLQLAILNTFTESEGAFPDMVMAILTRNSVRRAFDLGITAGQIVAFMRSNSHPIAVDKFGTTGCVPQTVVDQINLWEVERSRFTHSPGVLYSNFATRNEYLGAMTYAKENNILKWSSPQNRQIIIDSDGHQAFKHWWATSKKH